MKCELPDKKVTYKDFKPYKKDNKVFDLYILTETSFDKVDGVDVTNVLGVYSTRKKAFRAAVYWRQNHKAEKQTLTIDCQPLDSSPFSYLDIQNINFTDDEDTNESL